MKSVLRPAIAILTACMPLMALAAAPSNVRDIRAEVVTDGVKVSWTKVAGDVASYRVFYSHASILENDGLYDDFESADGAADSHVLKNIARGGDLFVSVLAVNAAGEESALFLEEANVTVEASAAVSSVASVSAMPTPLAPNELRMLSAESISATGVTLTFSHTVDIPAAQALSAFMVHNASGGILPLKRLLIQGNTVTLHTFPQERNIVYRVTPGAVISGKDAAGNTLTLAADQSPMLFAGHADGIAPGTYKPTVSSSAVSAATTNKNEVMSLHLRAQPEEGGTYTVEASWQPGSDGIDGYMVSQTRDKGVTYGQPVSIGETSTSVKVRKVPAGSFGVMVKTVYADGTTSKGITQTIDLPGKQGSSSPKTPITGSVTGKDLGNLPNSGPALWVLTAAAGGMAGYWRVRRSKVTA